MATFLEAVMIQIGVYLAVIGFVIIAINFLTGGFLIKWMKVKASRGALILLKVRTLNLDYFTTGELMDGFLVFKSRSKAKKRIAITISQSSAIYKSFGVSVIDIDEEKNAFQLHDWSKVSGFDAEKSEDLYTRALMKPHQMENELKMILVAVVVVAVLVAGGFYLSYSWHQETLLAISNLKSVSQPVAQAIVTGGS